MDEDRPDRDDGDLIDRTDDDVISQDVEEYEVIEEVDKEQEKDEMGGGGTPE